MLQVIPAALGEIPNIPSQHLQEFSPLNTQLLSPRLLNLALNTTNAAVKLLNHFYNLIHTLSTYILLWILWYQRISQSRGTVGH